MKKRVWSFTIISVALLSSSYAVARAQAAPLSIFSDPVPGGMCGCMSCNCYFPDGLRSTEIERAPMSVYIDPRSLTASLESIHDAREDAVIKAQTPSTATKSTSLTSGSTVTKTSTAASGASKTTTAASTPSASLVSGSSKPANTNSAASSGSKAVNSSTASLTSDSSGSSKNSSGSPDDRDTVKSGATSVSSAAKNSSGSPDDRNVVKSGATSVSSSAKNSSESPDDREKKSSATGKSSGMYPYDSATGKEKAGSSIRADFMDSLGDTSNWVAPKVEKALYDPTRIVPAPVSKPQVVEHGMGDNVKTLTPITAKDPWDSFYSGFYKVDPTTGQRVVNMAPGPTLSKPEVKREVYYGPYSDKTNTKYWLDSKGDRVTEDPTKKKGTNN